MTLKNNTSLIIDFLNEIGIHVIPQKLSGECFLPGLKVFKSNILVDYEQLKYPGDLLHEAGHIAVTEVSLRPLTGTARLSEWPDQGGEIAAMLWSYAALCYLKLPLELVFHNNGYKGESQWLINEYENKRYHGLPLLEWMGLCLSEEKAALEKKPAFPVMLRWLR